MALAAVLFAPGAVAAELVVNKAAGAGVISRPFLRGMFGMRLRAWPDGTPVRVFVLADDNPVHVAFCTETLQVYPYQLRQNWERLVYSGTGQGPIQVATEEELLRRVAETPGAVGYVAQLPTGGLPPSVRMPNVR